MFLNNSFGGKEEGNFPPAEFNKKILQTRWDVLNYILISYLKFILSTLILTKEYNNSVSPWFHLPSDGKIIRLCSVSTPADLSPAMGLFKPYYGKM